MTEEIIDPYIGIVERAKQRVGLVLKEKWRLDQLLGVGGMAAVYAATHRNGSRTAIKMLHVEFSLDADTKRRFLREGYVANTVTHPGAVRVTDDDIAEDGAVFIVMDLLEGETLATRCHRLGGHLPPQELLLFTDQLLDVLAVAHEKGVVHRDIKPENVFVTVEGKIKLLDFGIARLRTMREGTVLTAHGAMFGSPAFMPPEQARGRTEQIDAQSDLWSVGAMMFSLIAGRFVHMAETFNEQLVAHAATHAPSLGLVAPNIPSAIVAIADRALSFEKAKRWPDARTMQEAVREAQAALGWPLDAPLSNLPPAVLSPPSPFPSATSNAEAGAAVAAGTMATDNIVRPPRGGLRGAVFIGVAGAMLLILVVLFLRRSSDHPAPARRADLEPQASAIAATTAPSGAPVVTPLAASVSPPPEPSVKPAESSPVDVRKPPAGAGRPAGSKPRSTTSPTGTPPPPAGDDDWLNRQH